MGRTLDEILAEEKPKVAQAACAKADAILIDLLLADLCSILGKRQKDITSAIGEAQPSIAALERGGADIKLSSLKCYVEATGAKLKLDIELPDGTRHGFKV